MSQTWREKEVIVGLCHIDTERKRWEEQKAGWKIETREKNRKRDEARGKGPKLYYKPRFLNTLKISPAYIENVSLLYVN